MTKGEKMSENSERMNAFVQRVIAAMNERIAEMNKRITDEVFLLIQNDSDLMQGYLEFAEDGKRKMLNQQIGKAVKDAYGLTNADFRVESPKSTLIKSHQAFE